VPYARGLVPTPTKELVEFRHKSEFAVGAYSGSRAYNRWTDDLEIVDVGNGTDSSPQWASVNGKAALVTNDAGLGNTHLYLTAWANGAKACVIHNMVMDAQIGYPAISYSMDAVDSKGHTIPLPDNYSGNGPDIPCLMVSKSAGDTIKSGIAAQSRLRMDIEVSIGKRPVRVVVGDRKGYSQPDKIIMVGGHHDSVYLGPGAVDNAAGAAATIGLAREIGKLHPAKTIRFATFGGEEEGLLGSYEYYKAYGDRLKGKMEIMLNLDMPNIDRARGNVLPIVVSDPRYLGTLNEIRAEAYAELPQLASYQVQISHGSLNSSSDMATFGLEGYRVASCWGSGSYEYHTPKDTAERINPESFLVVGAVYGSFALYLAGGRV
jgi:aminopeptidase YwaD